MPAASPPPSSPGSGDSARPFGAPPPHNIKLMVIALVLALVAVVLVNVYIQIDRVERAGKRVTVYRLNRTLMPGDKFKSNDVTPYDILEEDKEEGVIDGNAQMENYLGQRVRVLSPNGRYLAHGMFTMPVGSQASLEPARGKRHLPISVNSKKLIGSLRVGQYVDIEAPFDVGGSIAMILPVMERVRVLALGQHTLEDQETLSKRSGRVRGFRTITIEVDPWDASVLSMIERLAVGEFELRLRSSDDMLYPRIGGPGVNPQLKKMLEKSLKRPLPRQRSR